MSRALIVTLTLPVLLLSTSCATAETPVSTFPSPENPETMGDSGLLEGALENRNGCIVVEVLGEDVVPAFEDALVDWAEESQTLTVAGEDLTMGQQVALGGGGGPVEDGVTLGQGCGDVAEVWRVNTDGEPLGVAVTS